jgi:non-specific protein-tyrosine kinase
VNLPGYVRAVRRRRWIVVFVVLLGVGSAAGPDLVRPPRYSAEARLLVAGAASVGAAGGAQQEEAARRLSVARAIAYAQLVETAPGLAIAAQAAGVAQQHPAVSAAAEQGTPLLRVTASADTPEGARALAAAYREALPRIVRQVEQVPSSALPVITMLDPPQLSTRPSWPRLAHGLPIAGLLALLIGLAVAVLRDRLDPRLRDTAELADVAEVAVLGAVPREQAGRLLPALYAPRSGRAEAFRTVRTNLEFGGRQGMPRSIVVTSAGPGEGRSGLVANLAVSVAQAGRRVVVVDADLRRPSLARHFGLRPAIGLAEVLSGTARLDDVLLTVEGAQVVVLSSGATPAFPSELLGSVTMQTVLDRLEEAFDVVIVDSPPVLPVSDALLLAVQVQGTVVVARMGATTRAALRRAVQSLTGVGADVLGVAGNAVLRYEEKVRGNRYGYGDGYGATSSVAAPMPARLAPATGRRVVRAGDAAGGAVGRRGRRAAAAHDGADLVRPAPRNDVPRVPASGYQSPRDESQVIDMTWLESADSTAELPVVQQAESPVPPPRHEASTEQPVALTAQQMFDELFGRRGSQ